MDFAGGPGNIATTPSSTFIGYYDPADFHAGTLVGDGRGIEEGGGAAFNSVDPDIKATYTDQYVIGFERELARDWALALTYSHKRGNNHPAWQEVNGTYEPFEYTNEETGLTNTLFALTSNADERAFVLGSPDFMQSRVHAFNATLTKRMSSRWQLMTQCTFLRSTGSLASNFTQNGWGRQDGGVAWRSFGKSPNDFVNIGGRLIGDMPFSFKTQALVELPKGFQAGANFWFQSGGAFAPSVRTPVPGLGRQTILLKEKDGTDRWSKLSTTDLRLSWSGTLGQRARLSLFADAFNIFNSNDPQWVSSTRVTSDFFGRDDGIILPRRVQLGVKLGF